MNILEWAFGKNLTPAERLRKHQRALEKTQRELDRERVKLENQEKKLIIDIKKSAKNGQMGACKIQAKDLVRTRRYAITSAYTARIEGWLSQWQITSNISLRYVEKFYSMRTQLQAISLRIQVGFCTFESVSTLANSVLDCSHERADDAIHERCDADPRKHEP
jgi:charged multivesicular body protein 2A